MSQPHKIDLNQALTVACELAAQAGTLLLSRQKDLDQLKITNKEAQGIASSADYESEQLIFNGLRKVFPQTEMLGEEAAYIQLGGKPEAYASYKDKPWTWIVDPLDGTNNFLNGWDYFSICIALVDKGSVQMGLVYHPINQTRYYAIKSQGAWKQVGEQAPQPIIYRDRNKALSSALLVTGFLSEKGDQFEREFQQFRQLMGKSRGIRRLGSAALDLCMVSQGFFDGFWERGLAPWDVAAAGLIAQEAGITITDYKAEAFHPFQDSLVAAPPSLHRELISLIGP